MFQSKNPAKQPSNGLRVKHAYSVTRVEKVRQCDVCNNFNERFSNSSAIVKDNAIGAGGLGFNSHV